MIAAPFLNPAALSSPAVESCHPLDPIKFLSPRKRSIVPLSDNRFRHEPYTARVTVFSPAKPSLYCATPQMLKMKESQESSRVLVPDVLSSGPIVSHQEAATATTAVMSHGCRPQVKAKAKYAVVRFKHEAATYRAPFRVSEGDHVIVEADRGEHLGVVETISDDAPPFSVPNRISRRPTSEELKLLRWRRACEQLTTTATQSLASSFGIGLQILDTEYQMDGHKLTVYYASNEFVDFRKLQRLLFKAYRCRIWLVNIKEIRTDQASLA